MVETLAQHTTQPICGIHPSTTSNPSFADRADSESSPTSALAVGVARVATECPGPCTTERDLGVSEGQLSDQTTQHPHNRHLDLAPQQPGDIALPDEDLKAAVAQNNNSSVGRLESGANTRGFASRPPPHTNTKVAQLDGEALDASSSQAKQRAHRNRRRSSHSLSHENTPHRRAQPRLRFVGLSEANSSYSAPATTTKTTSSSSSSSSTTTPKLSATRSLPTPTTTIPVHGTGLTLPRRSSNTPSTTSAAPVLPRTVRPAATAIQPTPPPPTMTPFTTPGLSSSSINPSYSLATPASASVPASAPPSNPSTAAPGGKVTGASMMAAAAKERKDKGKGRALSGEDLEGLENEGDEEDGWHPLGEKALAKRGYHSFLSFSHPFHLERRWTLQRELGQGAYGLVISAQDSLSGETIAIKMITRVFDKVILARRCLREITLLRHLNGHENITGLIDLDTVTEDFNEVYMFMEPMEADLHQIIRSGQQLTNSHIQYFLYQLLRGMKYIHSANVIHRDLKPGNILVNADCELKICDLGLARGYRPDPTEWDPNCMPAGGPLTEYVATRWYRAPEVMLSYKSYSTAIDVWSIGCILAELLGQKPIFKGKDYIDQLNLILQVVGTPDEETLTRIGSEKACAYIRSLPLQRKVPFEKLYPNADPDAIDLLEKLLMFDPAKRITVKEALSHPFLTAYHDESDEPDCPAVFDKWEEVEGITTIDQFKLAIKREVEEFRSEVRDVEDWDPNAEEEEEVETLQSAGPFSDSPSMVPTSFSTHRDSLSGQERDPLTGRDSLSGLSPAFHSGATTPATPQSAFPEAALPMISRSRRSSGAAGVLGDPFGRRPMSMSFGITPFSGMTPLNGGAHPDGTQTMHRGRQGSRTSFSSEFAAMRGGKPRTASTTSGDGSFKPLLRGLSSLSVKDLHTSHHAPGQGQSSPPPMTVSPSDAPPSEVPLEFKTKKSRKAENSLGLRGT